MKWLSLSFVGILTGCVGYQAGPINGALAGARTVSVSFFKNETLEPRLVVAVNRALKRNLQQDGKYASDGKFVADDMDPQIGCIAMMMVLGTMRPALRLPGLPWPFSAEDAAVTIPTIVPAKTGMIDVRDIVDVAVTVLTEDGHEAKEYALTGPASISFHDVAAGLSEALGKQIDYVNVPVEAAREGMVSMGFPEWMADAMGEYTTAFSQGYGDFITDDVQLITGNPARKFGDFARDFAQVFGGKVIQAA